MKSVCYRIKNRLIIAVTAALAAAAALTGCGGSSPSGGALPSEFFTAPLSGEITVCAYDYMDYQNYLEDAARLFEERYPGTKVNIEVFSAMPVYREMYLDGQEVMVTSVESQNSAQSRADYLSRISTKIMSGEGADIYAMDVIPLHKFVDSGTLENLQAYMDADPYFNREDYRRNVIEALSYKGGLWFLPMSYSFNYYSYDSKLVPSSVPSAEGFGAGRALSAQEIINLGISLYNGRNKIFNGYAYDMYGFGIFSQLLDESIKSFLDIEGKRANFADGGFSSLMESVKRYVDEGYIYKGITSETDIEKLMQEIMETGTERPLFLFNSYYSLIPQFQRASGIQPSFSSGEGYNDEIAGIQALTDGSVPFANNQSFAINSQSKNKALAWAFIKFLLSEEMQLSTRMYAGFPLNNRAREEKTRLLFTGAFFGMNIEADLNDRQRKGIADYQAAVERLSDSINTFVIKDTIIAEMINSETRYYFDGSRTAQEAARVLQNKVDLYLNE